MYKPLFITMGKIFEANEKGEKRLFENCNIKSLKLILQSDKFTKTELEELKEGKFATRDESDMSMKAKENYISTHSYVKISSKVNNVTYFFAALEETDCYIVINAATGKFKFFSDAFTAIKQITIDLSLGINDFLINSQIETFRKDYMPINTACVEKIFEKITRVTVESFNADFGSFKEISDASYCKWVDENYFLVMYIIDERYLLNVLFLRSTSISSKELSELKRKGYQEIHSCFSSEPMEELLERKNINI